MKEIKVAHPFMDSFIEYLVTHYTQTQLSHHSITILTLTRFFRFTLC